MYPELTREVFVQEAKLSIKPFEIEYKRVDRASVYSVGQRVAKRFWTKRCIFLAGDSCHTHSSGAGQGMNAGMHDAVNLGWKLSLALHGVRKIEHLLRKYDIERRPNAEHLIKYDENISVLVTGRLPKGWHGEERDPHVVLGNILQEAKGFNTGLTIGYVDKPAILKRGGPVMNGTTTKSRAMIPAPAEAGFRAPDVKLLLPALFEPVWLHAVAPNRARFCVLVFAADVGKAGEDFRSFKRAINGSRLLSTAAKENGTNMSNRVKPQSASGTHVNGEATKRSVVPLDFLTILVGTAADTWHLLETGPFGKVFYDSDGTAHQRYGVHEGQGAVLVLPPDGWIGGRFDPGHQGTVEGIEAYFSGILHP